MTAFPRCLIVAALLASLVHTLSLAQDKPNDAIVPAPREGNWMKRHESFNERVKQGNVDLIFIGDSITQGWEANGKNVWAEYYAKRNADSRSQGTLSGGTTVENVLRIAGNRQLCPRRK